MPSRADAGLCVRVAFHMRSNRAVVDESTPIVGTVLIRDDLPYVERITPRFRGPGCRGDVVQISRIKRRHVARWIHKLRIGEDIARARRYAPRAPVAVAFVGRSADSA